MLAREPSALASLKLTFLEDVPDVFSNNAAVTLEQLSHLVDGQPDGITIKGSINFGQTVVCICKQCVCLYKHHLHCKMLVGEHPNP